MKSCEAFISSVSEYYNYLPSVTAKETFFYPLCTGHFVYERGYELYRNSFDSFLLLYIKSGELIVDYDNRHERVTANQFVLLDCYQPHGYRTEKECQCLWIHFDGPVAKAYYELITSRPGNVFSLHDPQPVLTKMQKIYNTFAENSPIKEALLSKQLTDILTGILLYMSQPQASTDHSGSVEEVVSYMNEHFAEELSVEQLAEMALLSPFHFIRIFKKETGYTPHEYLIHTRINNAKYLLKTTRRAVKDICFQTGFSSESVFCSSFKKNVGCTPAEYRRKDTM